MRISQGTYHNRLYMVEGRRRALNDFWAPKGPTIWCAVGAQKLYIDRSGVLL